VLRFEVTEQGQAGLPAIDLDDPIVVVGSSDAARIRLPAKIAKPEHVRIERGEWSGEASVDGVMRTRGEIGDGVTLEIGAYRLRVTPAPAGVVATPPQRTESLARELVRSMLGAGGAPTLEVERGPVIGAKRSLAPPESVLVVGRGDEAGWVILDGDLSKVHAEIRRGWDGVRVIDLESKNGTKIDGVSIREAELRDGAILEFGKVRIKFRDPAERHLDGGPRTNLPPPQPVTAAAPARGNSIVFYAALAIMVLAIAGFGWVLST
jgi:hypothetical protein